MTLRNKGRIGVTIIAVGVFVVAGVVALHVVVTVEKREDEKG